MSPTPVADRLVDLRSGVRRAVDRGRRAVAVRRSPSRSDELDPDDVELELAGPESRGVVHNLLQLYRHDLSEFRDYHLDEQGHYAYEYLDAYLAEPEREVYLVRAEGRLAGFVFTHLLPDGAWQVSEQFVVRPFRRRGVGRIALSKALEVHPGEWTCFVDDQNRGSFRMCSTVIDATAERARFRRGRSSKGFMGTIMRFAVPGSGPDDPATPVRPPSSQTA